jgi:hypothetical protein
MELLELIDEKHKAWTGRLFKEIGSPPLASSTSSSSSTLVSCDELEGQIFDRAECSQQKPEVNIWSWEKSDDKW